MPDPNNIPPVIGTPATPKFSGEGSFAVGTTATFFYYFSDINGQLYDPSNIDAAILDPSGNVIQTADAVDKIELGVFGYAWAIPSDAVTGKYTINITYTSETTVGTVTDTLSEDFVVIERGIGSFTIRQVSGRAFLESLIGYTQRIPVFNEVARFNRAKTTGYLTFPRWNQTAGIRVFTNGEITESGFNIDYFKGKITFDRPISTYDEITVDYNFRWFTDEELDSFLEQGVNVVNIWPPQSVYSVNNIPDRWFITAEFSAAIMAIRRWMFDIQFQEPAKVFGGLDRAKDAFGNMDTLKKNYEDQLNKMLEMKKYGPYTGLTKTITVPEFTLPGGRSRWFRYLFK